MIQPTNNRLRRLFAAAADGHYTLPSEFYDLLQAADHLRGLQLPADPVDEARRRLREDVLAAAMTGGDLPNVKQLAAARQAGPALAELAGVRANVLHDLDGQLVQEVTARAEQMIVEHLRPVQEEVLAEAAAVVEATGGVLAPERLLGAPDGVRSAASTFGALATRYGAVRMARGLLVEIQGGPSKDVRGRFGEFRNLKEMWPTMGTWQAGSPPWPEDQVKRLAWIVSSAAEPWCPTRAEQDALFVERYPTAEEMVAAAGGTG